MLRLRSSELWRVSAGFAQNPLIAAPSDGRTAGSRVQSRGLGRGHLNFPQGPKRLLWGKVFGQRTFFILASPPLVLQISDLSGKHTMFMKPLMNGYLTLVDALRFHFGVGSKSGQPLLLTLSA